MKKLLIVLTVLCMGMFCQGQILKNLSRQVSNDVQSSTEQKISSKINRSIDTLGKKINQGVDSLGKKKNKKKKTDNSPTTSSQDSIVTTDVSQPESNNTSGVNNASGPNDTGIQENVPSDDSGYVKFTLSSGKILTGGTVAVTGTSIMYGNLNEVNMIVTGPSTNESKKIALDKNGSFSTNWMAKSAGKYKITVKSSDGKASQTAPLNVYPFEQMDLITGPNKEETKKAYDKLKEITDIVQSELTQKDVVELQKKLNEVTQNKDKFLKLLDDIDAAGKGFDDVEKKYGSIPPDVSDNLSQLNTILSQQADQMEQANTMANHKPYDNSICEYLVMIKEICAVFSTVTNFWAKSATGILKNIALDKGVPAAAGAVDAKAGLGTEGDNLHKECAKVAATAVTDAESLSTVLGKAGFAGDLVQICADNFLKEYCSVMSGDLKHDYECIFTNASGNVWWKYNYSTEATITLRYPKNNQGGNIIKMKGNIEGNATRFYIFQDVNQMDEFKKEMKGRAKIISICVHAPASAPFATSQADKNTGFGAIARAVVTPAYYNIPIDADYDVANKKLKLFLNEALVDFSSEVHFTFGYLVIAAMIPLTTRVEFPINKAKLTLAKVIEKNNDFNVVTDAAHNLSIIGKGNFQLGKGSDIEHDINFSFSIKSE